MNDSIRPLDWRSLPLAAPDRVLIEASAGTGKTWTIAALYLRLLLEGEDPPAVEKILVATFTEAAARELHERLRLRLADAERELQRILGAATIAAGEGGERDSVLEWLADAFSEETETRRALRRIQIARMDFDRAPIGTIHMLCQRFLHDFPLDSGVAAAQANLDEDALLRECVEDFWRRRYLADTAVDPAESELFGGGPEKLLYDVHTLLAQDARVLAADGLQDLARGMESLHAEKSAARLRELAAKRELYAPRKTLLSNRLARIADALENGDDAEIHEALAAMPDAEQIDAQQRADTPLRLRDDPLIQRLMHLQGLARERKTFTRGRVLVAAREFCRVEIPRRAEQRQGQTYSLLIRNVHARVCDARGAFAQTLFAAYPYALVDEFQDTDKQQFEIFDAIFRDANRAPRGWLAMIGDPKQAIYGFRGGDIAAYLAARASAATRCAMDTNFRSTQALVHALNALYGAGAAGFGDTRIAYQPMRCGGKAEGAALCRNGNPAAPLHVHVFRGEAIGKNGEPETGLSAQETIALRDCAERIVELLNDPAASLGDNRVLAHDVAVLVPNNKQVGALRQLLARRAVSCAGSGRERVFDGETAQELELFLAAVLHPDDDGAVRGALSTALLGYGWRGIIGLQTDPPAFERELDRFARWHALARSRGVFGAVADLTAQRASALLRRDDGARILADVRHLGELIAAREAEASGIEGVITWFARTRRDGADDGERGHRVRPASDADAVRIMTLHAAKGLEFPIVFLPLAWRIAKRDGQFQPKVLRFHASDGTLCIDAGSGEFADNLARHFAEDLGERERLLYVAMTRARSALHVYWADRGVPENAPAWKIPAIDRLLRQAQVNSGLAFGEADLPSLAHQLGGMSVVGPAVPGAARHFATDVARVDLTPRSPLPALRPFEWLHSFTGITRWRIADDADAAAADESDAALPESNETAAQAEQAELLALDVFRGRRFGDAVHALLEESGMRAVERSALLARLAVEGLAAAGPDSESALLRMLERTRASDLGGGLRLMDLPAHERVAEFGFRFPIAASLCELRAVCATHGFAEVWPAHLRANELRGMLTGFADLICAHGGRYHVLDYKTNRLGTRVSDYTGAALDAAMIEHCYPLQALLYTLALHRYLQQRLLDYSPERHLGDSVYLFLRGVGLAAGAGVWRRRWPAALIRDLDAVFAGAEAAT
ncbi:MAG: UvrD-helicase domain-containing protein [Xanthomonadaceae bacterium]|nr:UvrD-helicase domain-containing protein [Xanthomonadaceae bacterium]